MNEFSLALLVLVLCALLHRFAPALQLVDAPEEAPERKRQKKPVPLIGGSALFLAGACAWAWLGDGLFSFPAALAPVSLWLVLALVLSYTVGLLDDLIKGGLTARQKIFGQAGAGLPLVVVGLELHGVLGAILAIPCAVAAMNLANTYDNSDGALTSLSAISLGFVAPAVALGLLAFLPFNIGNGGLVIRGDRRDPRAYLGDSGSHLIGMLVLCYPAAWGFFLLPALDLGRVSVLRIRAGRQIWSGDRLHLAHRMEDRGFSTWTVLAFLALIATPFIHRFWFAWIDGDELRVLVSVLMTCVLFGLMVWSTRTRVTRS
ncbi:MAG: MraY family glycosyltransferase [Planctomycetota bacterium]|nr:MraY family glycosyltransferase [Planctomycetota bacterium]